jgi:ferredoxin
MIITQQKEFKKLLKSIDNKSVFLIGCNECATLCHTGGEKELIDMKKALEEENINVTGWIVLEPACHLQNDKRLLRKRIGEIDKASKILVLACGNGLQTISEVLINKNIIPGNNTLFLGEIIHNNEFEKRCVMCGDCIQELYGGPCPVSRCPKIMLNGPCGGAKNGKCEINSNIDCIWDTIFRYFKNKKQLNLLKDIMKPKDWSKSNEMRRVL